MRQVILLALIFCSYAAAGEVYRCKGPLGDITFTNIKCPEHTASEHYATYQPEEEPPHPPPAPVEAPTPPIAAASGQPSAEPVHPAAPRMPDPPPTQAVNPPAIATPVQQPDQPIVQEPAQAEQPPLAPGYKCSDGDSTWLQSTPCPPAAAHASPKPVGRPTAAVTTASAPTATKPVAAPQETGTSQGPLCDQLISQATTAGQQKGGSGTDELNRLLAANGCRR